ncbi:MAG: TolC family protein [Dokdonella sp.]
MDFSSLVAAAPMARTWRTRIVARIAILAVLTLVPASPAIAAEGPLSLEDAVSRAVERAPMLLARDASQRSASEELLRADALPDPKLTFGVQNFPIGGPDAFTVSEDRMTMRRIGLSQTLPSRAKRDARRQLAQALVEQADAETLTTTLDVQRATAKAWVQLWGAQKGRDLLEDLRDQAGLAVRATRARLSGGGGSASDALAARGTELELQNRIDDADARIEQARAGLQRWLGELPTTSISAPPDFAEEPVPQNQLLANLDQLGQLLSWDAQEASADAALALARAEKSPDWSVGAGLARRGAGASNVAWLELGVDLPLFAGNRQDRGISARSADLEAVRATREEARRAQTELVRKSFARWEGLGLQVVRSRDGLLPLTHDRSRTALSAYSGGASLQDWLNARRDEIDTRLEYADLLAAWGQAWADLAYLLPQKETQPNRAAVNLPEISR